MAYVVKCIICGKITIHHHRCLKNNGSFPCSACIPNFKKGDAVIKDGWVVLCRLGHSDIAREYRECCRKLSVENG